MYSIALEPTFNRPQVFPIAARLRGGIGNALGRVARGAAGAIRGAAGRVAARFGGGSTSNS
jgi:hypothetical protein